MILDLIATVVFVSVLAVAAVKAWRKLPRAGSIAAGEPVCLACQIPARLLPSDSLICPACRRDVRIMGIGRVRPRAFAAPFWRLVWFTFILCIIALVSSAVLMAQLPKVTYISSHFSTQFDGEPYENLELGFGGHRTGQGPLQGELCADLYLQNGELVTLVVQSTGRKYQLIDARGHASQWSREPLGQQAILRWMGAGGINVADSEVQRQAPWMLRKLDAALHEQPFAGDITNGPRYLGSGGGSSSSSGPLPQVMPVCVIAWSVLWLAGLSLILRRATQAADGGQQ